ncbi:alpha/beta fold hydrolase [Anoxybacillus caldiproteolyticus]|nr:alpha/beta fold hydrolase [Anoxybacillus caldiproteolyticus]
MAHGFTSDKNSNGRFNILANAFTKAGFSVLTFDFSGCGESDDDRLTLEKEVDDLKSAIQFVKSRGYQTIGLYGHSLGSLICLKSYTSDIKTMVLSGALTNAMKYDWEQYFTKEQMKELKEKGYITIQRTGTWRHTIVVDKQMLRDFEDIRQPELLQRVTCPVLIIHGNSKKDEEELLLLERSQQGMQYLSKDSRLKVIDGATHSFLEHLEILKDLSTRWYVNHMS